MQSYESLYLLVLILAVSYRNFDVSDDYEVLYSWILVYFVIDMVGKLYNRDLRNFCELTIFRLLVGEPSG